ncbi:MAG: AtpZ/AtpI family protein [Alphaproteobacteria bacterium]
MKDRDRKGHSEGRDDPELSQRLQALEQRLNKRRASVRDDEDKPPPPGTALALRLASEFIAGVILGAALGWGFDRLFGTSPWGLVIFLLLGFVAGVLTVVRTAGVVSPGPAGPDDHGDRI